MFSWLRRAQDPRDLTPADVHRLCAEPGGVRLVDVRSPREYLQGRIAGALSAPLGATARIAAAWPREQPVVLVCLSGHRSRVAGRALLGMGFADVSHLAGGLLAWRRAGLPLAR